MCILSIFFIKIYDVIWVIYVHIIDIFYKDLWCNLGNICAYYPYFLKLIFSKKVYLYKKIWFFYDLDVGYFS